MCAPSIFWVERAHTQVRPNPGSTKKATRNQPSVDTVTDPVIAFWGDLCYTEGNPRDIPSSDGRRSLYGFNHILYREENDMELHIAETIRSLRRDRGITQEELAQAVGVTTQAVSKWERGEGYPDITLLPDIAAYFRVTLDTLCGIDGQKQEREIASIIHATADAPYAEGVRIAREGLTKYPRSVEIKRNLARALMGCTGKWTPPKEVLDEVIGLYEDILHHSSEPNTLSSHDVSLLCEAYVSMGEIKKAKQVAAIDRNGKYERQQLWCKILQGDELISHIQNSIIQTLPDIHFMVKDILKTDCYTAREKIALCQKMIGVYALFHEDADWPLGMVFSYQFYMQIAVLSMELHDEASCLTALDKAADLAIRIDSLPAEGYPSSLLLNRIDFRYLSGTASDRAFLREAMEAEAVFESLRKTAAYETIIAKLT